MTTFFESKFRLLLISNNNNNSISNSSSNGGINTTISNTDLFDEYCQRYFLFF